MLANLCAKNTWLCFQKVLEKQNLKDNEQYYLMKRKKIHLLIQNFGRKEKKKPVVWSACSYKVSVLWLTRELAAEGTVQD